MTDQDNASDKQLDKAGDSKLADSAEARSQAQTGMKDLSDDTKQYYQARKRGHARQIHR